MDSIAYVLNVGFNGLGLMRYLVAGVAPAAVALILVQLGRLDDHRRMTALTIRRVVILLCAGFSPMLFLGAAHALGAQKDVTLGAVVRIAAVNSQYMEVCASASDRVSAADVRSASDFLRAKDVLWPAPGKSTWAALTASEPIPCGTRPNVDLENGVHLRNAYESIARILSILGYASFFALMVALCAEWGGPRRRMGSVATGDL